MPRANRHFIPGLIWHLTHRCHERQFLFKFAQDRSAYLHWLFEARKRHGLCVLDYMVTSNHVHLLIKDTGEEVISRSLQLVAGRSAQAYNRRKARKGAFWEDRYHATAVEANEHLHRCIAYIDLNMVRAGVVNHPGAWAHSGYNEIQSPPSRNRVIDLDALSETCGFNSIATLQQAHRMWIEARLATGSNTKEQCWSEAIALGSEPFVRTVKEQLGLRGVHREVAITSERYVLRERTPSYQANFAPENAALSHENAFLWRPR